MPPHVSPGAAARATANELELLPQPRPPADPMSGPKRERDPICDVCGHCHVQGVKCTICGHVGKYIGAARTHAQSHPHATRSAPAPAHIFAAC